MISFIDEHREVYGVEPICRVLPIAPLTYYAHVTRRADLDKQPVRARSDVDSMIGIQRVFEAKFCVYCVRKIRRQLALEKIGHSMHGGAADAQVGLGRCCAG